MKCDRCGKETIIHRMSKFNTDNCCMNCIDKETKHPLYKAACDADIEAVRNGNYNFEGIGKPADL